MYNKKKICPLCHWIRAYDSNKDIWNINDYVYCPMCGKKLITDGYSPDI